MVTYEEGECLLELGDLLLGERISLQYGVSIYLECCQRAAPC